MSTYTINHREFVIRNLHGTILDHLKYSETHVSSSGGGGHVGRYGGHVSAPSVWSESITNQDLWIRDKDGLEHAIQFSDVDIPLRPGQEVSLLMIGEKGGEYAYYVAVTNHNTDTSDMVTTIDELGKELNLYPMTGISFLILFFGGASSVAALTMFDNPAVAGMLAGATLFSLLFRAGIRSAKVDQIKAGLESEFRKSVKEHKESLKKLDQPATLR